MDLNRKEIDVFLDEKIKSFQKETKNDYQTTMNMIRGLIGSLFSSYEEDGKLTYSNLSKFGRLEKFEKELYNELDKLYKKKKKGFLELVRNIFEEVYYLNGFLLETQLQEKLGYRKLKKETIEEKVMYPIDGLSIEERMQQHHNTLGTSLKSTVIGMAMTGVAFTTLDKMMKKKMNVDLNKMFLMSEQESHRLSSEAIQSSLEVAGKKVKVQKKWVSSLDGRTRDTHRKLDGQTVGIDEYFTIGNKKAMMPRMFRIKEEDINCRCSVVLVYPESKLDERTQGNSNLIDYKTYEEWAKDRLKK